MINNCKLIDIKTFIDNRGNLSIVETQNIFDFKRIFYIYNVPQNFKRGCHAHKDTKQCLICVSGKFDVYIDNGKDNMIYKMNNPQIGLIMEPYVWNELYNFSSNSICFVLASKEYEVDDYITDYEEFLKIMRK